MAINSVMVARHGGLIAIRRLLDARRMYRAVLEPNGEQGASVQALWVIMPNGEECAVDVLPGAVAVEYQNGNHKQAQLCCSAIMVQDTTATLWGATTGGYYLRCLSHVQFKPLKRKLVGKHRPKPKKADIRPLSRPAGPF